ncbi:Ferredoxin II [Candidatus Hodgkinia cicadicola]|nr:Ferredoxin II [Candidatus Hodgkinia cicadicola]
MRTLRRSRAIKSAAEPNLEDWIETSCKRERIKPNITRRGLPPSKAGESNGTQFSIKPLLARAQAGSGNID